MYEVKIYGEITSFEDPQISEYGFCNLTTVQKQLAKARGKPLLVRINSFGGDCAIGFAIYHELRRYAKKNNVEIHTFGEAYVASIATIIFLAGDKRTLTGATAPFVHNAWSYAEGNSGVMIKVSQELTEWDNRIAKHYSEHTDLSFSEAIELMNSETSIMPELALEMRFCTDIEEVLKPKALKKYESKLKTNNSKRMAKPENKKSWIEKALAALKGGVTNKLVMTADEVEVNFVDLADDEEPKVGDKAEVDGAPADGDYTMKTGEIYTFVEGELTEIVPADEEPTVEDLKALVVELTNKLEEATANSQKDKAAIAALKKATSEQPENKGRNKENKDNKNNPAVKGSTAKSAFQKMLDNEKNKK